ncbi:hypothetical protein FRB99_003009 [Tulasnella sp. 403]|nr:hypothetical protein FRB99_003009 [Tulasnella sp. 403]
MRSCTRPNICRRQFHWNDYSDHGYIEAIEYLQEIREAGAITELGLCGGFLADKWLGSPDPDDEYESLTPSQRKYLDVIKTAWGTWSLFQSLLQVLKTIGDRRGERSISNIATRWVLDHDFVGCVIVGSRLGLSEHVADNDRVYGFRLSPEDKAAIEGVLVRSNGRKMIWTLGDCGAEYRAQEDK